MSSMMLMRWAIFFIATTVCCTDSPPSVASLAALLAMPSVTLAFSVFWLMLALICSTDALVSSTLAACSLVAWLIDCAVALTSSEALARLSAALRTSPMMCDSLPTMLRMALSTMPVSSLEPWPMWALRLPSASCSAAVAASFSGREMIRAMNSARPRPIIKAAISTTMIEIREVSYRLVPLLPAIVAPASFSSTIFCS